MSSHHPAHVSVAAHRAAIEELLGVAPVERVPLDHRACGRHLAADLVARDDLPRFDNSAMDGYAVRLAPARGDRSAAPSATDDTAGDAAGDTAGDTVGDTVTPTQTFAVVGDVAAGDAPKVAVGPGEAVRVMTGARLPEGTQSVVPVERTDAARTGPAPGSVTVTGRVDPGRHVRLRGEDLRAGDLVAAAGTRVTAGVLALARSAGCVEAELRARTSVAVVATGAELTGPGLDPGPGGIHESNSGMVAALVEAAGCVLARVEICPDEPDRLRALLDGLDGDPGVDLVVTTGGVSAGAYEVVRQVCSPLPTFDFVHLAMQPGGPQGLGCYGSTPVVCLPGTPVGAFVAFHVLVRPGLDRRHGAPAARAGRAAYVGKTRHTRAGRVQFVTSVLHDDGTVTAPDARHLTALAAANCLIEVPEAVDELVEGDLVVVHPL
ncbi:gephyrin-like molybdotransferase Glp [Terrabacter sp. NPDC080008]|uniref:molybdopterin molybdotransferase MoeA n=1 Tax=Terrabacter sp. NPDC080008 TaxID=3155176 RepID=UPI00344D26B7